MRLISHVFVSLGLVMLLLARPVAAQLANSTQLKNDLQQRLNMPIQSITPTEVPGLYQAVASAGIFYVSEDGKTVIQGKMYRFTEEGLIDRTGLALEQLRVSGLEQLKRPFVSFPAKNEQHEVFIFTDVECGFCRKLHERVEEYNALGITLHYMAYPRAGLNSAVADKMRAVWCAEDPQKAMTKAKNGQTITSEACDQPVAEHFQFGRQVGVTGTPNIILSDGRMLGGYVEPKQLLTLLQE